MELANAGLANDVYVLAGTTAVQLIGKRHQLVNDGTISSTDGAGVVAMNGAGYLLNTGKIMGNTVSIFYSDTFATPGENTEPWISTVPSPATSATLGRSSRSIFFF